MVAFKYPRWSGKLGMAFLPPHIKLYDRSGVLDSKRDPLAHTEEEFRLGGDLQELHGHVSGDDKLEWRGAKCEHKAGEYVWIVKSGRTEQRTAAQEWNDAVLWQYITVSVGRLRDKKESLVKHHREWAE